MQRRPPPWLQAALVGGLALVGAVVSGEGDLTRMPDAVNPLLGGAVAALLLLRAGPAALAAVAVATAGGLAVVTDLPAGVVVAQGAGAALAAAAGLTVLRRALSEPPRIVGGGDCFAVVAAAVATALVSATVGVASLLAAGVLAGDEGWSAFGRWLLAEGATTLALVPALAIAFDRRARWPSRRRLEVAGIAVTLVAGVTIGIVLTQDHRYLAWPGVLWAALRLHRRGAATGSLFLGGAALVAATIPAGAFGPGVPDGAAAETAVLIAVAVVTAVRIALADEERDAARTRLQRERALLHTILDSSPALITAKDLDGRYTFANRPIVEDQGRDLVGHTDEDLFPPAAAAAFRPLDEAVLRTGETHQTDGGLPGDDRQFTVLRFPLRDERRRIAGLGTVAVDVTETRRALDAVQRSEALLADVQAQAHVGGWSVEADGTATWSAEAYRIAGTDPATWEPTEENFFALIHPDDLATAREAQHHGVVEGAPTRPRVRLVRPDGEIRFVEIQGRPEMRDGEFVRVTGFLRDVTEVVAAEEERRRAEERYRDLVERLPAVVYTADAARSEYRYVSPHVARLVGHTPDEWVRDPELWRRSIHPEDRRRVADALARVPERGSLAVEYRLVSRDGRTLWVRDEAVLRDGDGEPHLDGLLTDVTERKAFETQLQFLADHDPLTGLFNRRRFSEELELEVELVSRGGPASTVLMLDLDNFKYVNDSLGHQAGDALIRNVADLLDGRLRVTDTLTRLGGDEFAALLRGTDVDEARRLASDLLEAIRARAHTLGEGPVRVTASAGLAPIAPGGATGVEELLAAADLAMYEAKQAGRDRVAVFSPELHAEVSAGRSWADRIRDALDRDGFELFCQPIVDLVDGHVTQWEILVRMTGPDGEVIAPGEFLPTAERFGLMPAIDRWVILRTIALMEERLAAGERVRLEVNVSGASMGDPALIEEIERALSASPVAPGDLIFEVTETEAIANMDEARAFADRLRRLGCGFALDDFGSGFASFYYLKHLPLDLVKIDGDFVRGLTASHVDQEIVTAMIGVARALGHRTIAEFVGDEPTMELLRLIGVDFAQGYHCGRPQPAGSLGAAVGPPPG